MLKIFAGIEAEILESRLQRPSDEISFGGQQGDVKITNQQEQKTFTQYEESIPVDYTSDYSSYSYMSPYEFDFRMGDYHTDGTLKYSALDNFYNPYGTMGDLHRAQAMDEAYADMLNNGYDIYYDD